MIPIAMNLINQNAYLILCTVLFSIGIIGVLFRRNFIAVIMCIELMLNAVNLLIASYAAHSGNAEGQIMVFFIMVVAAAEVAIGLALMVLIYRNTGTTDIESLSQLKG